MLRNIFWEVSGHFFKTLNLIDCIKAYIRVEENSCGFLLASVEILNTDRVLGLSISKF